MKRLIRILCIALIVTVISGLSNVAFAATVNCQYTGGKTKDGTFSFTAIASRKGTATITFKMGKGTLKIGAQGYPKEPKVYGAYKITINDSDDNQVYFGVILNSSSKKVSFTVEKNKKYTVNVYHLNPFITARLYLGMEVWDVIRETSGTGIDYYSVDSAKWTTLPTIKATTPILFSKIKIK